MSFATYYQNISNSAATDGGGFAVTAMSHLIALEVRAQQTVVIDQSDGAPIPTVFDVARRGYRWQAITRDAEAARSWNRLGYLSGATFRLYHAEANTSSDLVLLGIGIDELDIVGRWGELTEFRIGGFATRATLETGTSNEIEGDLTLISEALLNNPPNWPYAGDTVNRYDTNGV